MAAKTASLVEEVSVDDTRDRKRKKRKDKEAKKSPVPAVVGLLLVVGIAAVIYFNPLQLRDKYITPQLQQIPIVKNLVKAPAPAEGGEEAAPAVSADELNTRIAQLETELANSKHLSDLKQSDIDTKQQEIDRLRAFEDAQTAFRAEKAEFDKMIAEGDPKAYTAFFEEISPENAEVLYPTIKGDQVTQKEVSRYISVIKEMDESGAAKMLEQLISGNLNLVVEILKKLDTTVAGEILNEMTAENSASVMKRWNPIPVG
ncbi:hypothetical protein FACS1894188_09760 [Clostridia bacterium]|nr:hypothetical protein FACS1894188_09760 [Clostridia bacterium]